VALLPREDGRPGLAPWGEPGMALPARSRAIGPWRLLDLNHRGRRRGRPARPRLTIRTHENFMYCIVVTFGSPSEIDRFLRTGEKP
jgi:hypothetical protein